MNDIIVKPFSASDLKKMLVAYAPANREGSAEKHDARLLIEEHPTRHRENQS